MAAGATTAAVKLIIDTDEADANIAEFVADANAKVDDLLGPEGLDDPTLTRIAKYLAAHFVTRRDPRVKATKTDATSDTFAVDEDEYLKLAASFDPTGLVAREFGVEGAEGRRRFEYAGEYDGGMS